MNNPELFKRTVGILKSAHEKGEIDHGLCSSCAVGNLICANMYDGNKSLFSNQIYDDSEGWTHVFCTDSEDKTQEIKIENYKGVAKQQIDSTGYSVGDLAIIEYAFETADTPGYTNPTQEQWDSEDLSDFSMTDKQIIDWEVSGLRDVYDALLAIHDAKPEEVEPVDAVFPWPTI